MDDVRKISELVYRKLLALDAGGSGDWREGEADRMIAKDGDGGVKFSRRAGQYGRIVKLVLEAQKTIRG